MAHSIRPDGSNPSARARRAELVRAGVQRRVFTTREAQRVLLQKERRWAPIAYSVFFVALLVIFGTTYTTYAFSKYRGVILPGVYIDNTSLAGLTTSQAEGVITDKLAAIYGVPIILTYGSARWSPSKRDIGLQYDIPDTVRSAMDVGRTGPLISQLFDRLPVHPDHSIPLLYRLNEPVLRAYVTRAIASSPAVRRPAANANLTIRNGHVVLLPSHAGSSLDIPGTLDVIHRAMGALSKQTTTLPVLHIAPMVTDAYARSIQSRVESFLGKPPVIGVGKRVIPMTRGQLAAMLYFPPHPTVSGRKAFIELHVNPTAVSSYVASIAAQVDRQARNAQLSFDGRKVSVVSPIRMGRALDQSAAVTKLLNVLHALQPAARLRFHITTTPPPIDLTNPASLKITTWLGTGESNFVGADQTRLNDIVAITQRLKDVLLPPNQAISFNTLVGSDWPAGFYVDQEQGSGGQVVPGTGGAMQQVATTFFRALYAAGLQLLERHAHVYRLPWYEPPVGLDAIVNPPTDDLRFYNDTGHYLLLEPRVEPIRQEVYLYVYGPKLGWQVSISSSASITKVIPHGPAVTRQDPSLAPGQRRQTAWPHDGADTTITRTITRPNGNVNVEHLYTHYRPWQAIILVGVAATPTPTPAATPTPRPAKSKTATPSPTPTPTYSH